MPSKWLAGLTIDMGGKIISHTNKTRSQYPTLHLFNRGNVTGKFKLGTKIHAVENNGLPISIVISPANHHDSTKLIDVVENISDFVDDGMIEEIASVYADKGYDSGTIRNYLKNRNIVPCIPKRNYKTNNKQSPHQNNYNKTRFVVERFFAWLKNGFHRTRIRYEKSAENYLTFNIFYLACIMMYWRVLG